ncbi:MAG: hypothetical protein ABIM99_03640 [Candidatus Dojkabacteria bacterium]
MPIALASSNIEGQDLELTVDTAYEQNYDTIELQINDSIIDKDYRDRLIFSINTQNITNVVLHLPSVNKITEELIIAVLELINGIKEEHTYVDGVVLNTRLDRLKKDIKLVGLVHYIDGEMPINFPALTTSVGDRTKPFLSVDIPRFENMIVGVENDKNKIFDLKTVLATLNFARLHSIPFVFNMESIMYPLKLSNEKTPSFINDNIKRQILRSIRIIIGKMDPKVDIIHTSGKSEFDLVEEFGCPLGAEEDISKDLIGDLKNFIKSGGILVIENNTLADAMIGRRNLEA